MEDLEERVTDYADELQSGYFIPPAPTGVGATDTAALQAQLNLIAAAGGGVLRPRAGTYVMNAGLTYSGDNLTVDLGPGVVLDFSGVSGAVTAFSFDGTEAASVALTANAAKGATSLTVAAGAEAGFAAGDWVRVGSTRNWSPTLAPDGTIDQAIGEHVQVDSTSSGSIALRWPLVGGAYNTADTAAVSKITPVEGITITGGTIRGKDGEAQDCLDFDKAVAVRITGTRFEGWGKRSVALNDVIDAVVDGVHVDGGTTAQTAHYAISCVHGCQDVTVSGCYLTRVRHGVTTGGSLARFGINRRIRVVGCTGVNTMNAAFDSHAGCEELTIERCSVVGEDSYGMNIRCPKARISGNWITNTVNQGINCHNQSSEPTSYVIEGNHIRGSNDTGIYVHNDTDTNLVGTSAGEAIDGVVIRGNVVVAPTAGSGVRVYSSAAWNWHSVTVADNVVRSLPSTTGEGGVDLEQVDDSTCSGNSVTNLGVLSNGIRVTECNRVAVTGNAVRYTSTSTNPAFRFATAAECAATGNTVTNAATGVSVDSSSSQCAVTGNNLRGCTTPATLQGSNHVQGGNTHSVATVASAAALNLPDLGGYFAISGTTNITSITADRFYGQPVTLRFQGILTVTDGSNLKLAGNFVTAADSTITLVCDGTNWYEIARSAN